ncbi:MAG: LysR family transcriptional regulator [Opitutales bacterium]
MDPLPFLNYHHLHYFLTIVKEGGVTRAARKLNVSQSTLSAQLRTLEETLGVQLFDRQGRSLALTPAGRVALEYAEEIFQRGDELRAWFAGRSDVRTGTIRVGSLSFLSKNLQFEILRPLIMAGEVTVRVIDGEFSELLDRLKRHQLDLLLGNLPVTGPEADAVRVHLLGRMPMYLVGRPPFKVPKKPFPAWLEDLPLFLPTSRSPARVDFDALLVRSGIAPRIMAEIDDMALLRLLALSGAGLALVPEIGVKFDLEERKLLRIERVPDLFEHFYAITPRQKELPGPSRQAIEAGQQALAELARSSRPRKRKGG